MQGNDKDTAVLDHMLATARGDWTKPATIRALYNEYTQITGMAQPPEMWNGIPE